MHTQPNTEQTSHHHHHHHINNNSEDTAALGGAFTPSPPPPPPAPVRKRRSGSFGSMGSSGSGSGSGSGGGWFGRRMTAGAWAGGGDEGNNKGAQSLPLHRDRMARRKFFADGAKLRAFHFEPGLVYGA